MVALAGDTPNVLAADSRVLKPSRRAWLDRWEKLGFRLGFIPVCWVNAPPPRRTQLRRVGHARIVVDWIEMPVVHVGF